MPRRETCGADEDQWDCDRVDERIRGAIAEGSTLVLPLASIIETGNHIAQSDRLRFEKANELLDLIRKAADESSPWAAFSEQADLWGPEALRELADTWPALASSGLSIGDATIKRVADYYAKTHSYRVEILTCDEGLKAYEPSPPTRIPRRYKKQ